MIGVLGWRRIDLPKSSFPCAPRVFSPPIESFDIILCSLPLFGFSISMNEVDVDPTKYSGGPSLRKSIISFAALDTLGTVEGGPVEGGPASKKSIKSRVFDETLGARLGVVGTDGGERLDGSFTASS